MADNISLPDDPDAFPVVGCEGVPTRLDTNPEEEIKGKLFLRDCEGLDKEQDRKRDQFINNCEIPDPPVGKLYTKDYPAESFPGAPPIEVPKNLITTLLFGDSKQNHIPRDFIQYPVYCHPRSKFLMKESDGTFSEVDLVGNRVSYDPDDTNKRIPNNKVKKAPYLTSSVKNPNDGGSGGGGGDTTVGHIYNAEWSPVHDCWVITGGDCEDSNYAYTPYIVVRVSGHFTELNKQDGPDLSGVIELGNEETPTTFDVNLLGIYDIAGSDATSKNLFATEPIFTLGGGGDSIVYTNIRLNPGTAGIALYRFIFYYCNGAERDIYIVAFKCVEANQAPTYEPKVSTIKLKEGEEYDEIIGKITDLDNDTVSLKNIKIDGDNILSTVELTVDESGNVHLKMEAENPGTVKISFTPDDNHNGISTYGFYEEQHIYVYVGSTNLAPVVTITQPRIDVKPKQRIRNMEVGTVTDSDATVVGDANFIFEMIRHSVPNKVAEGELTVKNGKILLNAQVLDIGHGEDDVTFRIHDVRQNYKDGMPEPNTIKFVVDSSITYEVVQSALTLAPNQVIPRAYFGRVTADYDNPAYKIIRLSKDVPDNVISGDLHITPTGVVYGTNITATDTEGFETFVGKVIDKYGNETDQFTITFIVTTE